mgnify:CR=1 FL=1
MLSTDQINSLLILSDFLDSAVLLMGEAHIPPEESLYLLGLLVNCGLLSPDLELTSDGELYLLTDLTSLS